jgi:hypothetical protein
MVPSKGVEYIKEEVMPHINNLSNYSKQLVCGHYMNAIEQLPNTDTILQISNILQKSLTN